VGTVPYSITGPLIGSLIRSRASWAVIALQKDVVDRIISEPGDERYGSVSVISQLYFDIELRGIYPPSSFYPEPEVFTQVIIMRRKKEPEEFIDSFERFLKCLFSQRRKLLPKALRICYGECAEKRIPEHLRSERVHRLRPEEIKLIFLEIMRDKG
jgi:16S rRNA (adenine1518-N6/adenine1519-N6)-dimethyltransferase